MTVVEDLALSELCIKNKHEHENYKKETCYFVFVIR